MKRFILSLCLALLIAYTWNSDWIATWYWVDYPGQNPPGKWVMIDLTPNL